jgi:hypothetical protein
LLLAVGCISSNSYPALKLAGMTSGGTGLIFLLYVLIVPVNLPKKGDMNWGQYYE